MLHVVSAFSYSVERSFKSVTRALYTIVNMSVYDIFPTMMGACTYAPSSLATRLRVGMVRVRVRVKVIVSRW